MTSGLLYAVVGCLLFVFGLTESRVCQLHKQCVLQLKQRLVDSIY